MLPLCKFYRYLIYRLYHFKDDTPIANTILTLGVVHFFICSAIFSVLLEYTQIKFCTSKNEAVILGIVWLIAHYFLFYNKKKWQSYNEEFKDENPKQRRRGLILVLSYLIGSIVVCFVVWGFLIYYK